MARTYFRGASGCVVMFDVTNQKSIDSAREWKQELDTKVELPNGESIPCILLGNKVSGDQVSGTVYIYRSCVCMRVETQIATVQIHIFITLNFGTANRQ